MSGIDEIRVTRPWRQTDKGSWSMSLHGGGVTVRITQRTPHDVFQRIVLVDGKQMWQTLGTRDREEAERAVRACLRHLITAHQEVRPTALEETPAEARAIGEPSPASWPLGGTRPQADEPVRSLLDVEQLFTMYLESASFANLRATTQNDYRSRGRILVAGLGPRSLVANLDLEATARYTERRLAGGIEYDAPRPGAADLPAEPKRSDPVSDTSVGADLALLRHMLHWATVTRDRTGAFLLAEFPIRGLRVRRNKRPKRPHIDHGRFTTLLEVVQRLAREAEASGDSVWLRRWRLLELALVITEGTGARVSAVRNLWVSDLELDRQNGFRHARIRWRSIHDKTKESHDQPLPVELARLLAFLLDRLGLTGDQCVFAKLRSPRAAVTYKELSDWFLEAEERAGLGKLGGGVWHPLRRKWVQDRRACPLKDLMAAGGWSDMKTLLGYLAEPEEEALRAVMEAPARAREARSGALGEQRHEAVGEATKGGLHGGPRRLRLLR